MNIIQIFKQFPTQKSCIKHLEKLRWGKTPVCVYCGSTNTNLLKKENRHHCNGCRKSFNVTVGTIFHGTHVPLQKWFLLISLMQNAKKGLSSCQAARDIEMNRPTVWSMMHRIRKAMSSDNSLLSGIIEMDETYVGGKPRKDNKKDDENNTGSPRGSPRGRGTKKTPVVGMVERGGNVKAKSVAKNELKFTDFLKMIRKNINVAESLLVTDEYKAYNRMSKVIPHYSVNHSYEYAKSDIHTNTIESFWAILKRGITGQFHWVSKKYLNAYIDEFCYRYNAREIDSSSVFTITIANMLRG
jgi:transposase-like protein